MGSFGLEDSTNPWPSQAPRGLVGSSEGHGERGQALDKRPRHLARGRAKNGAGSGTSWQIQEHKLEVVPCGDYPERVLRESLLKCGRHDGPDV